MNNAAMTALRTLSNDSGWSVVDAKGRTHMFGLTEERAIDMAKTIKGARAVRA